MPEIEYGKERTTCGGMSQSTRLAFEDAVELDHGVPQCPEAKQFVCIFFELQEESINVLIRLYSIDSNGRRNDLLVAVR